MKRIKIYRFDGSSCNGCDIEVLSLLALDIPLEDLGLSIVEDPQEADTLVVTGGLNVKSGTELERVYSQMQEPRRVIAIGSCGATMGIYKGGYSVTGPVDRLIPVDWYILGCPPRTQAIASALVITLGLPASGIEAALTTPAGLRNLPQVDGETCIGCVACANMCPAAAIDISDGEERLVKFTHKDCICCGTCEDICPVKAVTLSRSGEPWYKDKLGALSQAAAALKTCPVCGKGVVPIAQVDWAVKRTDEKLSLDDDIQPRIREAAGICPNCRRDNIGMIKEAKRTITSIDLKAHL